MKTLLILLMGAFSLSAFGQGVETEWQAFAPPAEEFALEVPEGFGSAPLYNPNRKPEDPRAYHALIGDTYYFVFSDDLNKPAQNDWVFSFAGDRAVRNLEKAVFNFWDEFGYYNRILMLQTANRVYTFQTTSKNGVNPASDRFFAGIKLGGTKPTLTEKIAISTMSPEKKTMVRNDDNKGFGIGVGSGTGTGNGSNDGIGSGNGGTAQRTGLVILAKPRASYTDYARFYQIVGTVRVRVKFSANGEIGEIIPQTTLPFGLTEAAVEAAKGLRFKPELRNGQPVDVSKIVEYSFTIY